MCSSKERLVYHGFLYAILSPKRDTSSLGAATIRAEGGRLFISQTAHARRADHWWENRIENKIPEEPYIEIDNTVQMFHKWK